jgi:hypothetical protein
MAQTVIKIKCTDQVLETIEAPVIASGGFKSEKVHFEFCTLWDGFTKTAIFYVKKSEVYHAVLSADNTCIIPHEVLEKQGNMFFGVLGVNASGITRTSEVIKYKIVQGAISEEYKQSDPTPDIYEQILSKIANISKDFAPSGYGLGSAQPPVAEDLNKTLKNGFYFIWSGTQNAPFTHGAVLVSNYDSSEIVQYVMNTHSGMFMIRRTLDGGATWTEEWAIPAMFTGVEYRTTERWKGKAVYTKLLDFETLPNTATKTVYLNVAPTEIIEIKPQIVLWDSSTFGTLCQETAPSAEFVNSVRFLASFSTSGGSVHCYTNRDMTKYVAKVVVKYTKD